MRLWPVLGSILLAGSAPALAADTYIYKGEAFRGSAKDSDVIVALTLDRGRVTGTLSFRNVGESNFTLPTRVNGTFEDGTCTFSAGAYRFEGRCDDHEFVGEAFAEGEPTVKFSLPTDHAADSPSRQNRAALEARTTPAASTSSPGINTCDGLAGHPDDPQRRGAGVADEDIDLSAALTACVTALQSQPDVPRLMFQTGRVLWLAEEFEEAMPFLLDAAEQKEPAALAYLGDAYANGLGGADTDLDAALTFYTQAAAAGFTPADAAADEVAEELAETPVAGTPPPVSTSASTVNDCDRFAAHPSDPKKLGTGIADASVNAGRAIEACEVALDAFPNTARLEYQLGRSLYLGDRTTDALPYLASAAEKGYAPAKAIIADAYLEGAEGVDQDIGAAYTFYTEAAAGGFKPAAASAAELAKNFGDTAPAAGASGRLRLACEVLATRVDNMLTPLQYMNFKFNVALDFESGKATYSGDIPAVDSNMYVPAKPYSFSVGDDDIIKVDYDGFGEQPKYNVLQITMSDGKAYTLSEYRTPNIFGWKVANGMMFEGYCGEAAAAAPKPRPAKAKAKGKR